MKVDRDLSTGCGYCVEARPYEARYINPVSKKVDKCDFCSPRLERGQEPACVATCPAHAKYFGDLEDPKSEVFVLVYEKGARRLETADVAIGPNVYSLGSVFPKEKPAFFSMITGTVNELYAYRHHFKWWKEFKMQEAAWKGNLERGGEKAALGGSRQATAVEAPRPANVTPVAPGLRAALDRAFRRPEYWPPYVAGAGLGLTLLATFVLMGDGLGASGGFTRYLVAALACMAPKYASGHPYWSTYMESGQSPLINFLVFELIGVALGGFVSGWLAGRLRLAVDKGPRISPRTRYLLALAGGILTGIGARLARGCTSGLALSGGAVLSVGAFIFMLSVFAAGFGGAYFLRKCWL